MILKGIKDQEAAPVSKSFFSISTTQYSTQTLTGISIDQSLNAEEADHILAPLTEYLNKNLATLCESMSSTMVRECVRRLWDDSLSLFEAALVPPLYGQIERDRRVLNKRQISMIKWSKSILRDFFHADGADLGLPVRSLETRKYVEVTQLIDVYSTPLRRIKRDYELSLVQGREKEYLLKLVRLRSEKQEDLSQNDKEDERRWVDNQMRNRRDRR